MPRAGSLVCMLLASCGGALAPGSESPPRTAPAVPPAPSVAAPIEAPAAATPDSPIDAPMAAARRLIAAWTVAQRDLDFDAYIAHYAVDFAGTRRRDFDDEIDLDLAAWSADRAQAFLAGTITAIERPVLSIGGDGTTVIAELTQRTWRGGFSDHGQKTLVIDTTGAAPAITHEQMSWSRPGWDDAEEPIHDASGMTSPIAVRVVPGATDSDDCVGRAGTLVLEDATGETASIPIRTNATPASAKRAPRPVDGVYAWEDACEGLQVKRSVRQDRHRIVLREAWVDDGSGAGLYRHSLAILGPDATLELR